MFRFLGPEFCQGPARSQCLGSGGHQADATDLLMPSSCEQLCSEGSNSRHDWNMASLSLIWGGVPFCLNLYSRSSTILLTNCGCVLDTAQRLGFAGQDERLGFTAEYKGCGVPSVSVECSWHCLIAFANLYLTQRMLSPSSYVKQ